MLYKTISIVRVCTQSGHCNNVVYRKGAEEICVLQIFTNDGKYLVQCNTGSVDVEFESEADLEKYINDNYSLHSSSECFSCHNTIDVQIDKFKGECEICGNDFGYTHFSHEWCPLCNACVAVKRSS